MLPGTIVSKAQGAIPFTQAYRVFLLFSTYSAIQTNPWILPGIALAEYHISHLAVSVQDERLSPSHLVISGDQHLARAIHHHPSYRYSSNRLSFIESNIGVATLVLSRGVSTSETTIIKNRVAAEEYLANVLEQVIREDAEFDLLGDECEVLYGRAGLLYAFLYIRKKVIEKSLGEITFLSDLASDSHLSFLIDSIISRGKRGASFLASELKTADVPPLMWMWHGKRYLGGAHGVGK